MVLISPQTLKEIYQDIYNWQDDVSFNANETLRQLDRYKNSKF
jgi:hypothetical protein